MHEFFPIRVRHVESIARDPRGSQLDQHVRGAGGPAAGYPQASVGGATERGRQQCHLEGEDVLQIVHGHPWVQRKIHLDRVPQLDLLA